MRASSATGTELGAIAPVALVVDDDVAMRLLIRQTLERLGFACHEADNGIAALERFDQIAPDIVLLDVVMPGMNGYALCSELRRRPTGAFVPILMLTGLDDLESINRAYEVGATDFINKPINWGILGHRIRYILRANQAFSDLEKNRESLENAQRIAHLGSWEWELPRDTVHWSDETYRILGIAPDGVAPSFSAFLHCVHPDDRHAIQESMRHLLKMREFVGQVVRIQRQDGSVRHARLQGVRHLDSAGSVTRLSGTIQDVTEIKEAEERIRRSRVLRRVSPVTQPPVLHRAPAAGAGPCKALPASAGFAVAGSGPVQTHQRHPWSLCRQRTAVVGVAEALGRCASA